MCSACDFVCADVRGPDCLVSLLCSLGSGMVLAHAQVTLSDVLLDFLADGVDSQCAQVHRVGTHISNVSCLVECLRHAHSLADRHSQFACRLLLERRCGEWRRRCLLDGLDVDVCDVEGSVLAHFKELQRLASFCQASIQFGAESLSGLVGLRLELGCDTIIRLALEALNLVLSFRNKSHRHALHASCRQTGSDFLPKHRRQLESNDSVKHASCLLRIDEVAVNISRFLDGLQDSGLGNLMEHNTLGRLGL